jgi:ubiquinone/menaquinone biosynthesis C-methylase UbiE
MRLSDERAKRPSPGLSKPDVPEQFDSVAQRYDLLQRLNPGYRKHLRMSACRLAAKEDGRILDLCCGTGLSTEALVQAYPGAQLTALDASERMLVQARRKPELQRVRFILGDAMDPKAAGAEGPFDAILMAYGIRNVDDPDLCLSRMVALLAPGGRVAFHEYSVAGSRYHRWLWGVVASAIIVPLGRVLTGSSQLFTYLRRSVDEFDSVAGFEERLRRAGLVDVRTHTMDGWQRGIVHTFVAQRP